ncbi:hypothetical protein PAXRUDRAFT_20058 [Paxillus rubicundulus Ve08.2h10]|uniref:Uncharacterized protein n=1 Tax=Paxillus rubicundulus Ve08.2h10 TaxID=930991 RepID=A0A0D0CTB2_9AGAM|nr:hypothetical protein PAXRUDRAFT_20058 [Paxillus rubicundulus Ve08.2h10]
MVQQRWEFRMQFLQNISQIPPAMALLLTVVRDLLDVGHPGLSIALGHQVDHIQPWLAFRQADAGDFTVCVSSSCIRIVAEGFLGIVLPILLNVLQMVE